MDKQSILGGLALVVFVSPLSGQSGPTKYTSLDAGSQPPVADGSLADPAWETANWDEGFLTAQGETPGQDTRFAILHDADHLYVGIRLADTDASEISKIEGERDDVNGDRIAMFLDTDLDPATSYVFVTNAAGVVRDQRGQGNNGPWEMEWDAEWDAAVGVDDGGWTVEFRIPLSVMEDARANGEWGLQFTRVVDTRGETIMWRPVDQTVGWTASFGRMLFDTRTEGGRDPSTP